MNTGTPTADAHDIRPVVATGSSGNWGLYTFIVILLIGGFALFSALSANREQAGAPRTIVPDTGSARIASPPPLNLPPSLLQAEPLPVAPREVQPAPNPVPVRIQAVPQPAAAPPSNTRPVPASEPPTSASPEPGPRVLFEEQRVTLPPLPAAGQTPAEDRVQAGRLASPSMTVPQGTVIPAVLETALDSTRPGGVRALVQRDIHGFDGSRILIDRGSRLYGTYEAGLNPGERRALIRWTRLVRPDGVTIALDSPASDPLGRAGIEGDVDSRFFARFGGALLQSVLDIGVGIATREASDGVFVALPGSTQNVTTQQNQQVQPVLEVEHGTSVSVFVARDLDFSSVER